MSVLLTDVSIRTMIGLLPKIINNNNKNLSDYIDTIYDSDNDYIKKSVNTISDSNSYVKSYLGEFKNITVDNIIINNTDGLSTVLLSVDHNNLNSRFLYDNAGTVVVVSSDKLPTGMSNYAHNAGAIGIALNDGTVLSLATTINLIIGNVDKLKEYFKNSYQDNSYVNVYGSSNTSETSLDEPSSFTFDNSLLFASKVLLKRMNLPQYQYNDITSGFIYTYYDYSNIVKINDEHTASIKGIPGSIVNLKFDDLQKKAFYRIILSREKKKYLRISKDELNRVSLICVSNNELYGSEWDVLNYSVRSANDIMIETK